MPVNRHFVIAFADRVPNNQGSNIEVIRSG